MHASVPTQRSEFAELTPFVHALGHFSLQQRHRPLQPSPYRVGLICETEAIVHLGNDASLRPTHHHLWAGIESFGRHDE